MQMRDGGMMPMASSLLRIVMNPDAAEKLGLSEEQKTKLKALDKGRSAMREHMEKIREAMRKQTALIEADKIDEAAVMASIDEVFSLRKEMAKEQMKRLIAVKSILTPEQIKKANEEMKDMPRERGEGMRRGSGGGHHGRSMGGRRGRMRDGDHHERDGEAK
jgi:Spy/CpxP family protein refolding chaperone